MKRYYLIIALFTAAAFVVGCKRANEPEATVATDSGSTTARLDNVKQETKEAVQAAKDYAYAEKAQFVEKMRAELAALNSELDQLSTKVENSTQETKGEAKEKLQAVREHTARLNAQLDELKDATESKWDELKAGFKQSYEEVKGSFKRARQWLDEKI